MISYDRLQELRILADRGNAELGELLDAYELAEEYRDTTLTPSEVNSVLMERDDLRERVEDLEGAIDDAKNALDGV